MVEAVSLGEMYLTNHVQLVPGETLLLPPSAPGGGPTQSNGTTDTHLGLNTNRMSMTAQALPSLQIRHPTATSDRIFTHQQLPPGHPQPPHDRNPTSSTRTTNRNQNGSNRISPKKPALIVINPGHISDDGSGDLKLHRNLANSYPQRLEYHDTALHNQTNPPGYHCLSTEKSKDKGKVPEQNISNRGLDSNAGGAFHVVEQSKRCEGNDAKPPGSPKSSLHRPTLTIVSPPMVPDLPADGGKVEIFSANQKYGRMGNDDGRWLSQLQHQQQHSGQRSLQHQQQQQHSGQRSLQQQYEHLRSSPEQEQQHKKRDHHRSQQNQEQMFQHSPSLQYPEQQEEHQTSFQRPQQVYEHQTSFQHQMPLYEHQTSFQHQKQAYDHQTSLQHQKQAYDHQTSLQQDVQLQQQRNPQQSQKLQHVQPDHQRSSPLHGQVYERQTLLQEEEHQYEHQRSLQQDIQQQQQQQQQWTHQRVQQVEQYKNEHQRSSQRDIQRQQQQQQQWTHQRLQQLDQYQNEPQRSSLQNRNHNMIPNHNETTSPFDMVNNSSRDHNFHQRHYQQHLHDDHPPQMYNNFPPTPSDISSQPSAFFPTSSASLAKPGNCKIPVIVISSSPAQKQNRQETNSPDSSLLSPRYLEVPSLRSRPAASTLLVPPVRTGHQRSRSANPPKSRPLIVSRPDPPPRPLNLSRPDPPPRSSNLRRSHSQPRPLNLSTSDPHSVRHVDFQPIDKPFTPDLDLEKPIDKSPPPEPPLRISSSPHLPPIAVWQEERTHPLAMISPTRQKRISNSGDSSNIPSLERSARTDQGSTTLQLPKLYFSPGHEEDRSPFSKMEVFTSPSLHKPLPHRQDSNQPSSSLSSPSRCSSNAQLLPPHQSLLCVAQEINTSALTPPNRISPSLQSSPHHYEELSHQSPMRKPELPPRTAASHPRPISYHGDLNSQPPHDRPHPPTRISSTIQVSSSPNRDLSRSLPSMISSLELSARVPSPRHSQSFPKEDSNSSMSRTASPCSTTNDRPGPVATLEDLTNVRLRPIRERTTLQLPRTSDNFDELPPPPPPHELVLSPEDLAILAADSSPPHQHTTSSSCSQLPKASAHSPAGRFQAVNMSNTDFVIPDDIDLSKCPGLVEINQSIPNWKRDMVEKKNQEKIEEYVKRVLKEREQEAKWKNVPEWKKKILQKKDEEEATGSNVAPETKSSSKNPEIKVALKKATKKPPPPPPKDIKVDLSSIKPKGDIVPAAFSIDPEELAAMPPWKRELLFKRDKVPVTFSNEFNPDEDSAADSDKTTS